jgi:hypothetical protein
VVWEISGLTIRLRANDTTPAAIADAEVLLRVWTAP